MDDTGTISGHTAVASALVAVGAGHDFQSIEAETGISSEGLLDPDAPVPDVYLSKLVALLERTSGGRNLAMFLGRRLPLEAIGPGWPLLRRAPTMAAMLRLYALSHKLSGTALQVEVAFEPEPALTLGHTNDAHDGGLGAEVGTSLAVRCARRLFGARSVARVEFQHTPRGRQGAYESTFGVPVVFAAPHNRILGNPTMLDAPNTAFAVEPEHLIARQLRQLMRDHGLLSEDSLTTVREAIIHCSADGRYSVDAVAAHLGVSRRVLQRRVGARGLSVSALIDQYRLELAKALLRNERRALVDVADQVGFDSERGFRKAFRRWAGITASQWRATERAHAGAGSG